MSKTRIMYGSIELGDNSDCVVRACAEHAIRSGPEHRYRAEEMPSSEHPGITLATLRPRGADRPYGVSFKTDDPFAREAACNALLWAARQHHPRNESVVVQLGAIVAADRVVVVTRLPEITGVVVLE